MGPSDRRPDRDAVLAYLRAQGGRVQVEGGTNGAQARALCPACQKARALCVALDGDRAGAWTCFHCSGSGGWTDLRAAFGDRPDHAPSGRWERPGAARVADLARGITQATFRRPSGAPVAEPAPRTETPPDPSHPLAFAHDLDSRCESALWGEPWAASVLTYLRDVRRLPEEALRAFHLGAHRLPARGVPDAAVLLVSIPVYDARGQLVTVRFRTVPGTCPACGGAGCAPPEKGRRASCDGGRVAKAYLRCPGRPTALYNVASLPADPDHMVIVTEGELDVVALYAYCVATGVVSGTAGAGHAWPPEHLDLLEPYRQVVLCYDADEAGDKGAEALAAQLGRYRCARARLPRKDAGECLADGVPDERVIEAVRHAPPMVDVDVRRVGSFRQEYEARLSAPAGVRGRPTGLTSLDTAIGGWRPGLVVVTGDTSAGKSTLTTYLAYLEAKRGVPVLLTAFEDQLEVVGTLLRVHLGRDPTEVGPDIRRGAWDALDALPLVVSAHWGQLAPARAVELVRYAVRRLGVRFAVLDHLGFLVDDAADDERRMIEATVRALYTVAKEDGITVAAVAHPNRVPTVQRRRVRASDLKGATAIAQDADLVLVVERVRPAKDGRARAVVHVDKARSHYATIGGKAWLWYDRGAARYADTALEVQPSRGVVVEPEADARAVAGPDGEP